MTLQELVTLEGEMLVRMLALGSDGFVHRPREGYLFHRCFGVGVNESRSLWALGRFLPNEEVRVERTWVGEIA